MLARLEAGQRLSSTDAKDVRQRYSIGPQSLRVVI